jgi:hypothetical protein
VVAPLVTAVVVDVGAVSSGGGGASQGKGKAGLAVMLATLLHTRPQVCVCVCVWGGGCLLCVFYVRACVMPQAQQRSPHGECLSVPQSRNFCSCCCLSFL